LAGLTIEGAHHFGSPALIVCSCNVLSDEDVRSAVSASGEMPRTARQVYGCLGCSAECGRCARTINTIIKDALGACARECAANCPHSQASHSHAAHSHASHSEPAMAAVVRVAQVSIA